MGRKSLYIAIVLGAVGVSAPGVLVGQTDEMAGDQATAEGGDVEAGQVSQQSTPDQMQEMLKAMAPGENHKHLEFFVGKWDTVTKIYMGGPGSPAMESPGTTEITSVLGGRYIQETHKGVMMGMPYDGFGMVGYDNAKNLYVGTWYSNMSTEVLVYKGARDPSGKKFTYYGEMDEPMISVYGRTVKYVTTILSEDQYRLDIIDLHAGDDYKVIEIEYTRRETDE